VPNYAPPPSYNPQPSYAPPPANPWGQQQASPWSQPQAAPASGGFLKGALGAAAGVAGGVLLADGIRDLFAGHSNNFTQLAGIDTAAGTGGGGGFADPSYDPGVPDVGPGQDQDIATDQQFDQDIDNDPGNDDSFNV